MSNIQCRTKDGEKLKIGRFPPWRDCTLIFFPVNKAVVNMRSDWKVQFLISGTLAGTGGAALSRAWGYGRTQFCGRCPLP